MLASVYIKDGNIHFYNENRSLTNIGGIAYALGKPLLDFVCYEPERFNDGFAITASAFDNEYARESVKDPMFIETVKASLDEFQQHEVYVYFYHRMLMEFVITFADSPRMAVEHLAEQIPGVEVKLGWAMDFEWPASSPPFVEIAQCADKEKWLYRAAMDAVTLMSENIRQTQEIMINEVDLLISFREVVGAPKKSSLEYLYWMEQYRMKETGEYFCLETPMRSFYGALPSSEEVVELYEINRIDDLCRFELVKMIEHDIFIKKCKNCGRFFIPRRRMDAEYCDRIHGDGPRRCSEIGANLRYEKKVAENPILEAYSKAYKRFNSRTRVKKMTQAEFLRWSEEARELRDECVAGTLPFEEFTAWLEQGRIRKSRKERFGD